MRARRFDGSTTGLGRFGAGGFAGDSKLERPKLWEVWTDRSTKPDGVDYGFWDNIVVGICSPQVLRSDFLRPMCLLFGGILALDFSSFYRILSFTD